ncbi:MAG: DUF1800 domain-containing protein [Planctomycetes bacterium]|nr:DUF1800 domain-containing protein [Planctomycetota bacterium]
MLLEPPAEAPEDRLTSSLVPIKKQAFGDSEARHLLWRAGFGGTAEQIATLASWGPEKAVDHILNFEKVPGEPIPADKFDREIMRPPTPAEREMYRAAQRAQDENKLAEVRRMRQEREQSDRQQMANIQKWWLTRMIETPRPLEEKLTLFWHGLLATNYRTIENSYHMFAQNQLFRKHAAGNYGDLLHGLIRDPAMIAYLDNNDSKKNKPNENLAREIMELFSLGIGNYTERDIKEGARALTGFTFEDDDFVFQAKNHDTGQKTIFGKTAPFDGDGFVDAILAQPACSRYISRRLYHFFVADVPPDERGGDKELDPAQRSVLRQLASNLAGGNYNIRPVLRKLFLSEHFYEPRFRNQQIKSPVELVVGAIRSLNAPPRDLSILNDALDLMGQRIFFPPSVKGWDGGRSWINTSTLFVRQNVLAFLLTGKKPQGYDATADTQKFDALAVLGDVRDPDDAVAKVLHVTLGQAPPEARTALRNYIRTQQDTLTQDSACGMLLLATAMPEYQLC